MDDIVTSDCDCKGEPYREGTVHCQDGKAEVVEVMNPTTGEIWMDRNLGASQVATASDDELAYGDLYQWGRFSDGHQCRDSDIISTVSNSSDPDHGDFIVVEQVLPIDWLSPQYNDLWQGTNGINNPCPNGFRLPSESEYQEELLTWTSENVEGAFDSPLKFTAAGSRWYYDGQVLVAGINGYYWGSSVSGIDAYMLIFVSEFAVSGHGRRAYGRSVRCIKD